MQLIPTQNNRGFTIVELLIVVVVIAILAAITIVAYNGIQTRANNAAADTSVNTMAKKINNFYSLRGSYPATTTTLFSDLATYSESSLNGANLAVNASPGATNGKNTLRVELCGTGAGVRIFKYDFATKALTATPVLIGNTGGTCNPATA